jgi:hypothetical protein
MSSDNEEGNLIRKRTAGNRLVTVPSVSPTISKLPEKPIEKQLDKPNNEQKIKKQEKEVPQDIKDEIIQNIKAKNFNLDNYQIIIYNKGERGVQGPEGSVGPIGPEGPPGPRGRDGIPGPIGHTGPAGHIGPEGGIGLRGPAGPQGIRGAVGPPGSRGPAGDQGEPGIQGEQGPQGPAGICECNNSNPSSIKASVKYKNTIFVDQKFGNDDAGMPEDKAHSFQTMDAAIKASKAGDFIIVSPGSYGIVNLKPDVWIEASHGIVFFDIVKTSDSYKWSKNSAAHLKGITIKSYDRTPIILNKGFIIFVDCNILSIYTSQTNVDAYAVELNSAKTEFRNCNFNLQADGNNKIISLLYISGNENTEIAVDGGNIAINRVGNDSNIYLSYNVSKAINIKFQRAVVDFDIDETTNTFEHQYNTAQSSVNSEFTGNMVSAKRNIDDSKSEKRTTMNENIVSHVDSNAVSKWNNNNGINAKKENSIISNGQNNAFTSFTSLRVVTDSCNLNLNDKIIVINTDNNITLTLPQITGPETSLCKGSLATEIFEFKVLQSECLVTLKTLGDSRINTLEKSITLVSDRSIRLCSLGKDWITL